MHLCMKMNKRMQAMESKGKELVRRKATLLTERNKLLELMGTSSSLSILKDPTASTNSRFAPHSSFMYMLRTGTTTTTAIISITAACHSVNGLYILSAKSHRNQYC